MREYRFYFMIYVDNIFCELCPKPKKINIHFLINNCNKSNLDKDKDDLGPIYFYNCMKHNHHLLHLSCLSECKSYKIINCFVDNTKFLIYENEIKYENMIDYIKDELLKNNNKLINEYIEQNFEIIKSQIDISKNRNKDIKKFIGDFQAEINNYINNYKNEILNEDQNFREAEVRMVNWKENIISEINSKFYEKIDTMTEWTEYISTYYNENKKEILFTYNEYKKNPSNNIVKLFRFYPDNNEEEKYLIKYKGSNIWDKDEFENYFEKDDQIILIK